MLLAICDGLKYNRITSGNWSDGLEIIAVELTHNTSKKTLLSVCYRPPNSESMRKYLSLEISISPI